MSERILPARTYYTTFAALIALTLLTLGMTFLNLGSWHTAVGLTIAVSKAGLVALIFMHLLRAGRLPRLVIGGALLWLAILLGLTLADYLTRYQGAY
jgi:cytochrome c oxidase subunit 4